MKRRLLRWLMKCFDKAFYRSRGEQFLWLVGIVALFTVLGIVAGSFFNINEWKVVELMLDPGAFAGSYQDGPIVAIVQLLIAVIGAIVFTCLLINAFGNWLDRRIEAYRKGEIIYSFDDHVLILGANSMLFNVLKTVLKDIENVNRDIVIQTTTDVEELRAVLSTEIEAKYLNNIYVVFGKRDIKESLSLLDADEAKAIYILGEEDESMHDSVNIECYNCLKQICVCSKTVINCYISFDRLTTIQSFYYNNETVSTDKLHLTIINSIENTAQRVLVSRNYEDGLKYPSLDREGIDKDSDIGVHVIICGMSQMGYAIATTAAHVCHFPNFITKGIRTKITFIQEDIIKEMEYFKSRYQNLIDLSVVNYMDFSKPQSTIISYPDQDFLAPNSNKEGFIDIEWEFINGGIENEKIRDYITQCVEKDGKSEYLSLFFCDNNSEHNLTASLYLPRIVYYNSIPIFVYQNGKSKVIDNARKSKVYANVYSFGTRNESLDEDYLNRLVDARKISYLYHMTDNGMSFDRIPSDCDLLDTWYLLPYAFQQSNLYSANSVSFKLRSIKYDFISPLSDKDIDILSEIEHNRWNVERLLMGFSAYPYSLRQQFKYKLINGNDVTKKECKRKLNEVKLDMFIHKDIAPYDELLESSKEYDKAIVRNIPYLYNVESGN